MPVLRRPSELAAVTGRGLQYLLMFGVECHQTIQKSAWKFRADLDWGPRGLSGFGENSDSDGW